MTRKNLVVQERAISNSKTYLKVVKNSRKASGIRSFIDLRRAPICPNEGKTILSIKYYYNGQG